MSAKKDEIMKQVDSALATYDPKTAMLTLRNSHNITFPHELMGPRYQEWIESFNEEEKEIVTKGMQSLMSGNHAVMPRVCPGSEKCPIQSLCPFGSNTPNGLMCPVEQGFVISKMNDLMEEFKADGHNTTDHALLQRLTELELQSWRMSAYQSVRPEFALPLIEVEVSADMQGNRITQMQENPLFHMKAQISREKMKITQLLVANPEARYKRQAALKQVANNDVSNQLAKMNQLMADVEDRIRRKSAPAEIVVDKE